MVYTSGLWLFILSALILTVLILLTWRRRNIGAGRAFLFLMSGALIWTVAFTLEIATQGRELKLLMCKLQFLAIALIPVAWVYLVLSYIGRSKRRLFWILLSIPPVLTNLIVWFVPRPNWFWGHPVMVYDQAPFPVMNYDYCPWPGNSVKTRLFR